MKNKKTQFVIIGILALAVAGGAFAWFNRRDAPTGELGGMHRVEEAANLPTAKQAETVELDNGDTFNLVAGFVQKQINGKSLKMLAYNGSIPGPLIKVKQGSEVTVNFTNNTDVDSTIHSHGVRVENKFDGVPDVTQKPVKPGKSFTYKLKFPDAGMYWYHPHIREDYAQELGLYGNFLVEPNDQLYWNPVNREMPLFLDDMLVENGQIARFDSKTANHTLMGRFGNVMLVNGETDYRLEASMGEVIRLYFTNAANTRMFNVSVPGVKMKLVGGDNGKYERETFVDSVILGPSERAIVEVLFEQPGSYRLEHRTPQKTYPLATVAVSSQQASPSYASTFESLRTNEDTTATITLYRAEFEKPADKSLKLAVDMKGPSGMSSMNGGMQHMMGNGQMMGNSMMQMGENKPIEWEDDMGMMNRDSTTKTLEWKLTDEATGKANMKIDNWKFKVGDKVKIKIFNDPKAMHPMQHPIHIHGQKFLVLSTNGVPNENLVWKDTALVKTGDTVEFLVEMANPGDWMIHCHISEHLEAGMMMKFEIEEA